MKAHDEFGSFGIQALNVAHTHSSMSKRKILSDETITDFHMNEWPPFFKMVTFHF